MRRPLLASLALASLLAAWQLLPGCSSSDASAPAASGGSDGVAGASGAGAGGSSAGSGAAGTAGAGGAGGGQVIGQGGAAGGSAFEGCAKGSAEAKPLPLDLYVMLDQSASMAGPRWAAVTGALSDFVSAGGQDDLGVGLQFFPLPGGKTCSYEAYGVPEVPIGPLSINADPLKKALADHVPAGETPTLPALQGAYQLAQQWSTDHPGRTVAVILATDGEPNICGSTIDNTKTVAQNAHAGSPPIATFVVAVGENLGSLDAIAQVGGSTKAFQVDGSGGSTKEQFLAALSEIRGAAVSCELTIPTPASGELDPSLVNVTFTPSSGSTDAIVFPRVDTPTACPTDAPSWYYDDPAKPAHVVLCDNACQQVKAKAGGRVDIVFGCASVIK
jgi:hypothetical protein